MSDTAILVENLSKQYRIGKRENYKTLRDSVVGMVTSPFRFAVNGSSANGGQQGNGEREPKIWALKDVSFEVKQGEVIGVIGRNGAGKSTLLKILSRITEPTEGHVRLRGRVGSLLEVGTGFHPELSGRENIYLNGAVLGMKRVDIDRKFDEIAAFAEIEKFLDTPVKHYSSGMYMRLAFSVAAHLEPEILLVDEVLAVGDAAFQNKCLGKMSEVAREGRTVLFVSHNMAAVTRLCRRGFIFEQGNLSLDASIHDAAAVYLRSESGSSAQREWSTLSASPGDEVARLKSVRVISNGTISETVDIRYPITIEMDYWNLKDNAKLLCCFSFFNDQGVHLFNAADLGEAHSGAQPKPRGLHRFRCVIPANLFAEGQVSVVAEVSTRHPVYQIHFLEFDSVAFRVIDTGAPGSVRSGWGRTIPGVMRPQIPWEVEYLQQELN